MATFRVGQRVRIIGRTEPSAAPIGAEATIIEINDFRGRRTGQPLPYRVMLNNGVTDWQFAAHHLQPIQPERNRVVAWADCPFDPRKVGEIA